MNNHKIKHQYEPVMNFKGVMRQYASNIGTIKTNKKYTSAMKHDNCYGYPSLMYIRPFKHKKDLRIKIYLIFIGMLISLMVSGQVMLKGSVKDKSGKSVQGANLSVRNSYDGAITDSAGNFSFLYTVAGIDTLDVSAIGYHPFTKIVNAGSNKDLHIILEKDRNELNAVVVHSAGSFLTGGNSKNIVLSTLDVLTTSTDGDVSSALRFLPGAQQVGEREGLFVRGGTGEETKQYIDGAIVSSPYYKGAGNYAQRGRFNPYLFSGTAFSTGGYSATYGNALSSVLMLNSIDMPDKSEYNFTVSPIMAGAGLQHLSEKKNTSFGLNYGATFLHLYQYLFPAAPEITQVPVYHTADVNFRQRTKNGMVKLFAQFSANYTGLRETDVDSMYLKDETNVKNNNFYVNLNWKENFGKRWKLNWSNSFSVNNDEVQNRVVDAQNYPVSFNPEVFWMVMKNFNMHETQQYFQTRLVMEKKFSTLSTVRFGSVYTYHKSNVSLNAIDKALSDNYLAVFAEFDYYFLHDLIVTVGARSEYSSVLQKSKISPRVSAAYRINARNSLSAAYGIFYQQPADRYLFSSNSLNFEQAAHYILNYTNTSDGRLFRAEIYHKNYCSLIRTIPGWQENYTYNNTGNGYARGLDIFWKDKKSIRAFEYWVSYSYLDAKRDYLNYASSLEPDFTTPHTLSVVAKRFLMPLKTQLNLTYSFATGRPYYFFLPQEQIYVLKDKGHTPAYHNAGLSINYIPFGLAPNSNKSAVVVFSVSNLLNSRQVYGYKYSYNGTNKMAVGPFSQRFYFLGIFLNFGANRAQQAIDNNL